MRQKCQTSGFFLEKFFVVIYRPKHWHKCNFDVEVLLKI